MLNLYFGIPLDVFLKAIVVHGILITVFIVMSAKLQARGEKYANVYLIGFYLLTAVGFIINFIFIFIFIPFIVKILYYFTLYFLFLGTYFLFIFILIIYKSEKIITKKKQVIILVILSIITWIMVFVPNGIVINESTNWYPKYNPFFFWYLVLVLTTGSVGPIAYLSIKIHKNFKLESLKRRWKFFEWGLVLLFTFAYGTLISHVIPIENFRPIWSLISLFLVIGSSYLLYYGVGRKY